MISETEYLLSVTPDTLSYFVRVSDQLAGGFNQNPSLLLGLAYEHLHEGDQVEVPLHAQANFTHNRSLSLLSDLPSQTLDSILSIFQDTPGYSHPEIHPDLPPSIVLTREELSGFQDDHDYLAAFSPAT
jgi:hypothetical protein